MNKLLLTSYILLTTLSPAMAVDTYDLGTGMLTMPNLTVGETEYMDVKAVLGPVTVVGVGGNSTDPSIANMLGGPFPVPSSISALDVGTIILTMPDLAIGSNRYRDVQIRLGTVTVISVGASVPYFSRPPSPGM